MPAGTGNGALGPAGMETDSWRRGPGMAFHRQVPGNRGHRQLRRVLELCGRQLRRVLGLWGQQLRRVLDLSCWQLRWVLGLGGRQLRWVLDLGGWQLRRVLGLRRVLDLGGRQLRRVLGLGSSDGSEVGGSDGSWGTGFSRRAGGSRRALRNRRFSSASARPISSILASICPKLFISSTSGSGRIPSRRWVPGGPTLGSTVARLMPLPVGFPHPHQGPARHQEVSLNDIFYFVTHTTPSRPQHCASAPFLPLHSPLGAFMSAASAAD